MKNKELEVIINIGPPASGKSTWTKEFISKNNNWAKVSRDDFRYMLKNSGFCEPKIEKMITELVNNTIVNCLVNKLNVIVDNTNLKISSINTIINLVKDYANVSYRVFDVPYKTLLERDSTRERSVGKIVIDKMWKDWEILKDSFDFQPVKKSTKNNIIKPDFNSTLPHCVIFDLDGTLALNSTGRNMYDYKYVDSDTLNEVVAEQVKFHKSLGRKIIILSGRDEICKELTKEWLEFYGVEYDEIYMRPKGSFERDTVIKRRIYENEIKDKLNVIAWYDDRKQITDLVYDLGLFCFNVNQGNKIF